MEILYYTTQKEQNIVLSVHFLNVVLSKFEGKTKPNQNNKTTNKKHFHSLSLCRSCLNLLADFYREPKIYTELGIF